MAKNKEFIFPPTTIELATTKYSIKRFVYRFSFDEEKNRKKKTSPKPIKMNLCEGIALVLEYSHLQSIPSSTGKKGKLQAAHLLIEEFLKFLKNLEKNNKIDKN
tara:strand:- start:264 stop:575 length:312 start_codon:yes stop_codon:yes gene_type:complete